jgi:uncharacterized protein (TIGR00661 family)
VTNSVHQPAPPPLRGRATRIAYAVHGYGRGHATRSLAVLSELKKQHQVLVLAGGDAHAALAPELPVVRIPTLGFAYGKGTGSRSNLATLRYNAAAVLDLWCRGPVFEMMADVMRDFAPDVVISDAETFSHQVAHALRIPRISFDHMGILAFCKPSIDPADRLEASLDAFVYRTLMGTADRILVSSFYPAPARSDAVRVVPTLPRAEVRRATPSDGEHLLVYLNQGRHQFDERLRRLLEGTGLPVHVYGTPQRGAIGRLSFMAPSNQPFIDDLAACRAVISTAGNQLVGEAMQLGKPILVMPEHCVEQRLNARAVVELGIGMCVASRALTAEHLQRFLQRRDEFAASMLAQRRDGLAESLAAIAQYIEELTLGGMATGHLAAAGARARAGQPSRASAPARAALP